MVARRRGGVTQLVSVNLCFRRKNALLHPWESAVLAMVSGAAAQFMASPADLAKVQLQTEGRLKAMGFESRGDSILAVWGRIVRRGGGVRALWKGLLD